MTEQINTIPETAEVAEVENEIIEYDAKHWAGRVADIMTKAGENVGVKPALETLAILDADNNITSQYDPAELDLFLDEFEDAIKEADKKEDIINEHINKSSNEKPDNDSEDNV